MPRSDLPLAWILRGSIHTQHDATRAILHVAGLGHVCSAASCGKDDHAVTIPFHMRITVIQQLPEPQFIMLFAVCVLAALCVCVLAEF